MRRSDFFQVPVPERINVIGLDAGSDGTMWSNYKKHNANHHKGLAVCCSDVRNPYNKKSRFISLWNKICLAFLLSIIFAAFSDPQSFWKEIFESVVIACILTPYGLILDALAKCSYCHRKNVCVAAARYCGSCALTFFFVLSIINIVGGLVILFCHEDSACSVSQADGMKNFIIYFFLSLVLNQVLPLMTGSLNWIFYTWSGCLCCPQCRCVCSRRFYCWFCCLCNADENYTSDDDSSKNRFLCICPVKYSFCSLLTFFPVRKLLNIYKLAESTYEDDRQLFQEKYPGRISVDDIGCVNQFAEAVLKQGHECAESTTLEQSPLHNESA